jgi:hypothetical protein
MSLSYMILTMVSSQFMLSLNIDDIYSHISPQTECNKIMYRKEEMFVLRYKTTAEVV